MAVAVGDQRGGAVQPDRGGGPRRVLGAGQPPPRHLAAARLRLRLPLRRRHLHQDARGCVQCRNCLRSIPVSPIVSGSFADE